MSGFIANGLDRLKQNLFEAIDSLDPLNSLPNAILCPSKTEIHYLTRLAMDKGKCIANIQFLTFDTLISTLFAQLFLQQHIVNDSEIRFLTNNLQLNFEQNIFTEYLLKNRNTETLSGDHAEALRNVKNSIQALHWCVPAEALDEILKLAPKIFSKCILFGYFHQNLYGPMLFDIVKKIAQEVAFLHFDCVHSESKNFETLEKSPKDTDLYGGTNETASSIEFTITENLVETTEYILSLLPAKTNEKIAIICPSNEIAMLISRQLTRNNISHHNVFPKYSIDKNGNLIAAWYWWQKKSTLEDFVTFCDILQNAHEDLFPENFDVRRVLSAAFNRYPTARLNELITTLEDVPLRQVLEMYPLLPDAGTFGEFLSKTKNIFPEFSSLTRHFAENFYTHKSAFLTFFCEWSRKHREIDEELTPASVYVSNLQSVTRLPFDYIIVISQNENNRYGEEHLWPKLQANNIHYIAEKSGISLAFIERYKTYTGQLLIPEQCAKITKRPRETIPNEPISTSQQDTFSALSVIHKQRHNPEQIFDEFSYRSNDSAHPIPITAIERAYNNPEEIWYRYILRNISPEVSFEKKKFAGIFTHEYLSWTGNVTPSFSEFEQHILNKQKYFHEKFPKISPHLREALDPSDALMIVKKFSSIENFPFMSSEINLEAPTILSDGNKIPLFGRADCILSTFPFRKTFHADNVKNDILIIDYKTGTTSQDDIKKMTKKFTSMPATVPGLQLVLYGLIARALGYQNIQLLILNRDPYEPIAPIPFHAITASENFCFFERFLKTLMVDGVFGYSEPNPFTPNTFVPPLTEIPPPSEIIRAKREKLFWK